MPSVRCAQELREIVRLERLVSWLRTACLLFAFLWLLGSVCCCGWCLLSGSGRGLATAVGVGLGAGYVGGQKLGNETDADESSTDEEVRAARSRARAIRG